MDKVIEHLEALELSDSSLKGLHKTDLSQNRYQKLLASFLKGEHKKVVAYSSSRPELLDSIELKALMILSLLANGDKVQSYHVSVMGSKPLLENGIAYALVRLVKALWTNIKLPQLDLLAIDFYALKNILPTIVIYYSDFLLKEVLYHDGANKQLLESCSKTIMDSNNFASLHEANWQAQEHRLQALYYRRLGDNEKSEQCLDLYRNKFQPKLDKKIKLNRVAPKNFYQHKDFVSRLPELYQEIQELQAEVLLRSGIHQDTCFYYRCADCCEYTPPSVSLAEFLYIQQYIEDQGLDLAEFKKRAKAIQDKHELMYETKLEVVDQTASSDKEENLFNMSFRCPFLSEQGACEIHEARPFACRAFGLSTIDGKSVQACRFYLSQYQHNSSHVGEREVYDVRIHVAMLARANSYQASLSSEYQNMKQPIATLVAWLTKQ